MNKGQKAIISLLVVIAVLLTLNLVVMRSQTANAEAGVAGEGVPYIVKLLPHAQQDYLRVWSDGRIDRLTRIDSCDYNVAATAGPVEHPFSVIDAILVSHHDTPAAMVTYDDGRVDLVEPVEPFGPYNRCTIAGVGTPSFCTADTDRDGDVAPFDLAALLAQWGPCA